ncbi:MAG TPA: DUF6519 domain-containing protein, partial [Nakamurella sp.]
MNGGDISRTTFVPTRHYTGVRMQQGRVQLDADWNELVDIERHLGAAAATDAFGPVGMPKAAAGFELTVSPDGADLLMSPGRSWVDGTLCELEAERTAVTVVAGATLTVDAIVLDGVELLRHDWVEIGGDLGSTVARVSAVDTANLTVTVGLAPATETLGAGLGLSRVASYARQPDLPDPPSVTQDGDDPPHLELPAGR